MKVAWLQDMNPMAEAGGAQLNDRAKIIEGIRRGFDIRHVGPPGDNFYLDWADVFVVSNATAFSADYIAGATDTRKPVVWFIHDFANLCKVRLHYPMLERCMSCYRKPRWIPMMEQAKILVWLSPLHRDAWLYATPELEGVNYLLNPSSVSPADFHPLNMPRKGTLGVNGLLAFKGRKGIIEWAEENPGEPVTVVGPNPEPGPLPPNIEVAPPVPPYLMNELYNRFERFLHLPDTIGPFDRVAAEALLAGCQVVANKNVGALSYPWFTSRESVASHLETASSDFWETIAG